MAQACFLIFMLILKGYDCFINMTNSNANVMKSEHFMFWPNATIPFYVEPLHFDTVQSQAIMKTLAQFSTNTCLQFKPIFAPPKPTMHVMVFENPQAIRKCVISREGHSIDGPHRITLGYECLSSPQIDMLVMKGLGFPFEHNRASRDLYIDVLFENIEPDAIELFTKERILPAELRSLHYDMNSVMHFEERDFSKNGHRTIIFKYPGLKEKREELSKTDHQKIDIIYGEECKKRDRQLKIEICKNYPMTNRRKREIDTTVNLRINREIKPNISETDQIIKDLGIVEEMTELIENVHKISAKAVNIARENRCNDTKGNLRTNDEVTASNDIVNIVDKVAEYVKSIVESATKNLTILCDAEFKPVDRCGGSLWCPRSTKIGPVRYSTQHRPIYQQPTRHYGHEKNFQYEKVIRSGNSSEINRNKREVSNSSNENKHENPLISDINGRRRKYFEDNSEVSKEKGYFGRYSKEEQHYQTKKSWNQDNKLRIRGAVKKEVAIDTSEERVSRTERTTRKVEPYRERNRDFSNERDRNRNDRESRFPKPKMDMDNLSMANEKNKESYGKNRFVTENAAGIRNNNRGGFKKDVANSEERDMDIRQQDNRMGWKMRDEHKNEQERDRYSDGNKAKNKNFEADSSRERNERYKERNAKERKERYERYEKERYDEERNEEHEQGRYKMERTERYEKDRNEQQEKGRYEKERNERYEKESFMDDERKGFKKGKGKIDENDRELNYRPIGYTEERREKVRDVSRATERMKVKQITDTSRLPKTVPLSKKNKDFYGERKWLDGIVPYIVKDDPKYDMQDVRDRLEEVINILNRQTCLRMEEITEDETHNHEDYIVLDTSADFVTGKVGGRQQFGVLELFEGGQHRQHAAMVVMSMLGFYLELARHDRDNYVRVHMRHIRPDKLHHFEKLPEDATLPLPYDYKSATLPAWQFWRRIGRTGISTVATYKDKDPDGEVMKSLGQNKHILSKLDLIKINSVYGTECFEESASNEKV